VAPENKQVFFHAKNHLQTTQQRYSKIPKNVQENVFGRFFTLSKQGYEL
jgi:hypothetical protein